MVKIAVMNGSSKIVLPVTPESFEVTDGWNNTEISINKTGLVTMIGKRGLKSVTISSFLPDRDYPFLIPTGIKYTKPTTMKEASALVKKLDKGELDPWSVIEKLSSWRGKVLTLFISGTGKFVSWPCVIDGDFTYGMRDATGDVYYTITFKEYKKTGTKRTVKKPGGKDKGKGDGEKTVSAKSWAVQHTTRKKETINKVCRKYYGSTKKKDALYKQNQAALDKGFAKYEKSLSAAKQKAYKMLSKYNKPLPKGVKLTVTGE